MRERGVGKDVVSIGALIPIRESVKFEGKWIIEKFLGDFRSREEAIKAGVKPYEVLEFFNEFLNEGVNELWDIVCGVGSPTAYNNANARIGVGNSNAAHAYTQTGLQGASKTFKGMDSGYPKTQNQGGIGDRKAQWRATFGSAEGNHAWEEITVVNAADDTGKNLNRKVQSMGTKASGTTWVATLEITLS